MVILICDDSKKEREYCESLIRQYEAEHSIPIEIRVCESGKELLFKAADTFAELDLIYMDISMPGIDGIETTDHLRRMGYVGDIVFYTVSEQYAIEGYDREILNYVVKDKTTEERFFKILDKAVSRTREREEDILVLTCAGENRCISIESIWYFEIRQRIVTVHYGDGQTFEFYSTMMRLEEELFGRGFVRTHKSFLVQRGAISKMTARQILLHNGEELPAGQKYIAAIRRNEEKVKL